MKRRSLFTIVLASGLLLSASSWAEINEVGVEWINICEPCGNPDLGCRDDVAVDFYDTLRANGYQGLFNFGNAAAWESDFKEPNDQHYVDAADIVMHADHGGSCRFAFGNTNRDDCRLWASEAQWGNQDLEWIILDDCSVLPRNFAWDCWTDAFQGLHLILSFDTNAHDSCSRGQHFANKLVDGWTLVQAWFYACEQTEGAGTYAAVVSTGGTGGSTYNDHIWGFGSVVADPTSPSYWSWTHHHCD